MNIAIYSGSFNPPHVGHAMMASYVTQFVSEIDQVWLIVSPQNPLKATSSDISEKVRFSMLQLLAIELPDTVKISDFEFQLPRPSYTIDTLQALSKEYPQHKFKLLIGSDNWLIFDKWKKHREIIEHFGVIIYPRPGYNVDADSLPKNVTLLHDAPTADISSTFIRNAAAKGYDMTFFTTDLINRFIHTQNLYK